MERSAARSKVVSKHVLSWLTLVIACSMHAQSNGSTLYSDDFETGLGNWSNVSSGDNKNWTRDSSGTASSGTGPATGANGSNYYVYLETSSGSAYTAGDTAILLGPVVSGSNIHLKFAYHMYGRNIGELAVDVLTGGSWVNSVWYLAGQQHTSNSTAYLTADVDLSSYAVTQIRFRATAVGSYQGDIAIDKVDIESTPAGPIAPLFLSDPLAKASARQDQAYSDSIAADASDANGDSLIFSKVSGPTWLNVAVDGALSGTPESDSVGPNSFLVEVSDGVLSDIATLNIDVNDNTSPIVINSNGFELGLGDWSNVTSGDNKDWTRYSGSTPSSSTGPSGASDGSYYLYLETSSGQAYTAGDSAIFQSPGITDSNIHLKFKYHMYGTNIGTLALDVFTNDSWVNSIWSIAGQQQTGLGDPFTSVDIDLSAYALSQLRFRATAVGGYRGDIAIDSIEIESRPTGPVPPIFLSDPISKSDATQDQAYSDSIATDASDANGDSLVFSKVNGPAWLNIAVDGTLSGTPSSNDVGANSFLVQVSDAAFSSNATLDIEVNDGSAPVLLSNSDFELDLGDWNNVSVGDNKNWTRDLGGTTSSATGPASGAIGSNYYMYVETSSGSAYSVGDTAILESTSINASNIHLAFQYHMYGSNTGSLAIDVFDGNAWINDVWNISGQQHTSNGAGYTAVDVDLSTYVVSRLRLRVTAAGGYQGDIAVDNVGIYGNGSLGGGGGGSPSNIVFVTSQGFTGNLGGLIGADAICQSEANAAGLSGTFKAFLSDNNTSAASRLNHSALPYELVNGATIAANWTDLVDGMISNLPRVTASGSLVSGYAWTGSDSDGSKATYYPSDYPSGYQLDLTCNGWTMETSSLHYLGARGKVDDLSSWVDWWQGDGSSCSSQLGLYCIAQ